MEKVKKTYNTIFSKDKYKFILIYTLFCVLLFVGFILSIKSYKQYGFYIGIGWGHRLLISLPLFFACGGVIYKIIPDAINNFIAFYWWLFFMMSYIPLLVSYTMNGVGNRYGSSIFIYVIFILSVLGAYFVFKSNIHINIKFKLSHRKFWTILLGFYVLAYFYLFYKLGIPKKIPSLSQVYDVRLQYRYTTNRLADYFVQWFGNVINPFVLTYFFTKKKFKNCIPVVLLQVLLYSFTAYKSIMVILFLAPMFAVIIHKGVRKIYLQAMFLLGILIGIFFGIVRLLTPFFLIIDRTFLWPATIVLQHFEFFSSNPKMALSHSILGSVYANPYGKDEPGFIIGKVYYNKPEMRANTAWFGDAFDNFGYGGLILFSILIIIIFLIIKSLKNKNQIYISSLLFGSIVSLFNGALLTVMLTHGLLIALVIAFIMPYEEKQKQF